MDDFAVFSRAFTATQVADYVGVVSVPTPAPTPTPTPTPIVPSGSVNAVRTNASITIDGVAEAAWDSVIPYAVQYYGTGKQSNSSTATAKMMWDNTNLYVLIDVTDPSIDYSNSNAWERDGIEIFFNETSSTATSYSDDNNGDAFQYRFTGLTGSSGEGSTNAFASAGSSASSRYSGRDFKYTKTSYGYTVECKIPFYSSHSANDTVRFDITLMDCHGGKRLNEVWLTGSGKGSLYQNPNLMGTMTLVN
jgi:endo-1,4-beta-xylanase